MMADQGSTPIRILFLCTGNSARSQMAEALLRHYGNGRFAAYSAVTRPAERVHSLAIAAMEQIGIPLDGQFPKTLDTLMRDRDLSWSYVITTCDEAEEACPTFPGDTKRIHWDFPDPVAAPGMDDERLRAFRVVRDEIRRRVQLFVGLGVHQRLNSAR